MQTDIDAHMFANCQSCKHHLDNCITLFFLTAPSWETCQCCITRYVCISWCCKSLSYTYSHKGLPFFGISKLETSFPGITWKLLRPLPAAMGPHGPRRASTRSICTRRRISWCGAKVQWCARVWPCDVCHSPHLQGRRWIPASIWSLGRRGDLQGVGLLLFSHGKMSNKSKGGDALKKVPLRETHGYHFCLASKLPCAQICGLICLPYKVGASPMCMLHADVCI